MVNSIYRIKDVTILAHVDKWLGSPAATHKGVGGREIEGGKDRERAVGYITEEQT